MSEKEIEKALAEQAEGNQVDPPPAVQENLERARTNLKNKADDLSSKTKKSAQDANDAISRTAKTAKIEAEKKAKNAKEVVTGQVENAKAAALEAKDAVEQVAKDAQEAWTKRSSNGGQEAGEKRGDEVIEGYGKRKQDGLVDDEQNEDAAVKPAKQDDKPTHNGVDVGKTGEKVESKHAPADQGPQTEPSEQKRSADNKPKGKTDSNAEPESEKAEEEWDPDNDHDAEAEAYEANINEMLSASEKRAEKELLPDEIS